MITRFLKLNNLLEFLLEQWALFEKYSQQILQPIKIEKSMCLVDRIQLMAKCVEIIDNIQKTEISTSVSITAKNRLTELQKQFDATFLTPSITVIFYFFYSFSLLFFTFKKVFFL